VTADVSTAVRLWREGGLGATVGEQVDLARYQWFYANNPQGVARLNFVLHGMEQLPVGFLGIGLRQMYLGNEPVVGGTLVDFVISPRHRSVFPALMLQRQGRADALNSMQILYGLPDTKAVAICRRLESQLTFNLPRYVRVVRSMVYLERQAPHWIAAPLSVFVDTLDRAGICLQLATSQRVGEWLGEFDERFDRLWQKLDRSALCIGLRSREFLQWRFRQQPLRTYRIFVLHRHDDAELLTYFVCEIDSAILRVRDCLNIGTQRDFKVGLLLLSREARRMGLKSVEVQISGPAGLQRTLARAQFLVRSTRPFFAMVGQSLRDRAKSVRWYITPADEDV
jgi:hypothetical protein